MIMERRYLEFEKPLERIERKIAHFEDLKKTRSKDTSLEITRLNQDLREKRKEIFSHLSPWQKVQMARHPNRPRTLDYVERLCDTFYELHGDRIHGDDPAMVAGLGSFEGRTVAIIGNQKGRSTEENIARNFGMAHPEGYRKALRVMELAEKFRFPVISFIDTAGAHPHMEAEERNQALAIATNLYRMSFIATPIIAVVIGEGGSGGALGISVADKILMLEFSIYSVISPEGCASILWKDQKAVEEAANALKLTATDLKEFGIVDEVVVEPQGGAHRDPQEAADILRTALLKYLGGLEATPVAELLEKRYKKYREIGAFSIEEPEEE